MSAEHGNFTRAFIKVAGYDSPVSACIEIEMIGGRTFKEIVYCALDTTDNPDEWMLWLAAANWLRIRPKAKNIV